MRPSFSILASLSLLSLSFGTACGVAVDAAPPSSTTDDVTNKPQGPKCGGTDFMVGVYTMTRTRSVTDPGSCPLSYAVNPSLPIELERNPYAPSLLSVIVTYTLAPSDGRPATGRPIGCEAAIDDYRCTVVAKCTDGGTWGDWEDKLTMQISPGGITATGTLSRVMTASGCTANWDLVGVRR